MVAYTTLKAPTVSNASRSSSRIQTGNIQIQKFVSVSVTKNLNKLGVFLVSTVQKDIIEMLMILLTSFLLGNITRVKGRIADLNFGSFLFSSIFRKITNIAGKFV